MQVKGQKENCHFRVYRFAGYQMGRKSKGRIMFYPAHLSIRLCWRSGRSPALPYPPHRSINITFEKNVVIENFNCQGESIYQSRGGIFLLSLAYMMAKAVNSNKPQGERRKVRAKMAVNLYNPKHKVCFPKSVICRRWEEILRLLQETRIR